MGSQVQVPASAKGQRLDQYLVEVLPLLTRSRLKSLIEQGHVTLNDKPTTKTAQRLHGGEQLRVEIPAPVPAKPQAQDLPIRILFEDKDLVVLDKDAGMVVHPGAGHADGTLVNALLHRVKDLSGVGGELRPGIVHRLDRETSGCLVVAKHERSLTALQASFKARAVEKTYLALVHGQPPQEGRIETLYGRHPIHRQKFTGKVREGKPALTTFKLRERFEHAALLEVDLFTGRTHQIRVHLAEAGFPLLGDPLYGRGRKGKGKVPEVEEALGRQALHAWKLAFPHPKTGKAMHFEAPLPPDLEAALTALRPVPPPSAPRPRRKSR
ncbi:MAG: RluA family pseudouridine synthase [Myxococcota bacterium]|nr:RluA family pseudouridine synthase [Myxococcota bacterium]